LALIAATTHLPFWLGYPLAGGAVGWAIWPQATDLFWRFRGEPGLKASAVWSESKWWLRLDRKRSEPAHFRVTVRHELGAQTRTEFSQADSPFLAWYPDHFEPAGMPQKQPWGEYRVTWDVIRKVRGKRRKAGRARCRFNWQPFMPQAAQQSQ
jgi:hypothetical protein